MTPFLALLAVGAALVGAMGWLGGVAGAIGGGAALMAQLVAVALLRPAMRAPQPMFLARWLGGMGVRALGLGMLLVVAGLHPSVLAPLPASLGYLGTLLPLLFTETRFLK